MSMRFNKEQRLSRQSDFTQVRKLGARIHAGCFILQLYVPGSEDDKELRRVGIIASRKVGGAVKRNLGKRRMRELFRQHQDVLPKRCDMVIVLFSNFDHYSFNDLKTKYLEACRRAIKKQAS